MSETSVKKTYAAWQKAVLLGCGLIAVLGTLGVVGGLIKVTATLSDYGSSFSVPLLIAFVLMLLSVWLFAALGAMVVYIAKTNAEIKEALAR
jgi:hypothetical protein